MSKYIDVEYLFKCETCKHSTGDKCYIYCETGESYTPSMTKIPTADVVEVVRCKDCNHRNTPFCYLWYGSLGDTDYIIGTSDDFYCSYGERRE